MKYKVGFIGCGNMGGVLLSAAHKNIGAPNCCVCEKIPEKAEKFTREGVKLLDISELVSHSKYIFLAVKPQMLENVLSSVAEAIRANREAVIVTMAAGVEAAKIEQYIGAKLPVIRIMPNMPCSVERGVILYCYNNLVDEQMLEEFTDILAGVGLLDYIVEEKIDAASVVSGCGPAFVYMFAEALSKAAQKCGLDSDKAKLYALKTVEGAARLAQTSDKEISVLVDEVCSPKGTTIEGVEALRENGLYELLDKTVKASYNRTLELKDE